MGRGKRKGGGGRKKTAPIPDAVRFGPRKEGTGGLPVARQGFVNCLRRGKTAGKHCRNVYAEIDCNQQLYIVMYTNIHDGTKCRNVTGLPDWKEDNKAHAHYLQIKAWVKANPEKIVERFDWDPESIAAEGSEEQDDDDDDDEQEEVVQQQAPNNNRLKQQVQSLQAELEAKNERISELEDRNKELEDQLQSQKADTARCQRRLHLAEARQAGPRHRGREEHEEDEDEEEDHFIASGGDDDDADDDAGGASAAVGVGGASAQKRRRRRGKRPQEEEKKDDEADGSEDSEEEEEEDHQQQQRTRRGSNGRSGKKKKTGEDDTDSGTQQDDQVPGGRGLWSSKSSNLGAGSGSNGDGLLITHKDLETIRAENRKEMEAMKAQLLAQVRAELADAAAADAANAAAASISCQVEEQEEDNSTERPAATAAVTGGGGPILGGNTLPHSVSAGAAAAGAAAAASGTNADGRHKRRHETGFAHPASASDSVESSDDDTDGLCRRQRRSKRSKVDMMDEFESKAELPQMMKRSAAPTKREEREVEKSTEEEGTAAEYADHWKEATDKASGRPYYYVSLQLH